MTCLIDRVLSEERIKYVEDVFRIHLVGTEYTDFQEKNLRGDFWEKVPNFEYNIKMFETFSRNLPGDYFLKIGIFSAKVYTKNLPNYVTSYLPLSEICLSSKSL